jgi:hypothetical protein
MKQCITQDTPDCLDSFNLTSERLRLAGNGRLSLSVQAKIVIFKVSFHL